MLSTLINFTQGIIMKISMAFTIAYIFKRKIYIANAILGATTLYMIFVHYRISSTTSMEVYFYAPFVGLLMLFLTALIPASLETIALMNIMYFMGINRVESGEIRNVRELFGNKKARETMIAVFLCSLVFTVVVPILFLKMIGL